MTTLFTYSRTVGLAMVCCLAVPSGNARADDLRAVAQIPAELVQWHSGLTVIDDPCVMPEWKSTLTAIDPRDPTSQLPMRGAAGFPDAADKGPHSSRDSFVPAMTRSAPARTPR